MARVPYNPVPESSASGPAGEFENINPSPADFGGLQGQATQKLGADIGQAGQAAANNAIELQNRQNQIVSTDAFNKMQSSALNITAGDPNDPTKKGFLALQGKDALDAYPAAEAALETTRKSISDGLSNDAQRLAFDTASRRLQMFTLDSMRSHFIQQQSVYGATVSQAGQQNALRAVGTNPADDTTFNNNLEQMRLNAYREVQNRGNEGNPDILHAAVAKGEEALIVARVQAMQARDPVNGPTAALDWIQNGKMPDTPVPGQPLTYSPVSSHLSPAVAEQLNTHFKAVSEQSQVDAGINSVIGGPKAPPPAAQQRGAATNSAWERMVGVGGTDHGVEAGEDNSGNARVSPAGATGAAQTLESTAQETATKHGVPYNPDAIKPGPGYDSSYSKMLGRLYFGDMMERYSGNVTLATAAYNAGPGRVDDWLKTIGDPRKGVVSDATFASQIPISETKSYVQRVAQPSTSPNIAPPPAAHANAGAGAVAAAPSTGPAPGYAADGTALAAGTWDTSIQPASTDQTATAQPAVVRPGAAPPDTATQGGAAPGAPPPGAHAANAGAYGAESQMVEDAWKEAQNRFPGRPDLQQKLVRGVYEHISQQNVLQAKFESEQAKAEKDAQNGIMNGAITTLNNDPSKFDPKVLDAKKPDGSYVLAPDQRENLTRYSKQRLTESGIEDTAPYGKGYAQAYRDIFAPTDSPSKINDINDILRRGGPDGDLSGIGVQKLAQVFQLSRKSPDEQALNQTSASLLTYAKNHLSFEEDTGPIKIRDPKGEAIFNAQFVPRFEAGLAAAKASGNPKDVWNYLQQDNIDKMISGLRSPTQMAKDRMAATGEVAPGDVEQPGTPIPPPPTNIREPAGPDGKAGAPVQINPREWSSIMTVLPKAQNGQPFTHKAWSQALTMLLSDPAKMGPKFDEFFGPAGFSSESILNRLTSKQGAAGAPGGPASNNPVAGNAF